MNAKLLEISGNYLQFNKHFFILMYVPCILYSLLSRPTNAQHIYIYIYIYIYIHIYIHTHTHTHIYTYIHIYINNILYIVSTPTCFMHPHHLQGVLSFYFAKVIKINKVTNSIQSTD